MRARLIHLLGQRGAEYGGGACFEGAGKMERLCRAACQILND